MADIKDYLQGDSTTEIPVDIQFNENIRDVFLEKPPAYKPPTAHEKPGLFEAFRGEFAKHSEVLNVLNAVDTKIQDNSPYDDFVPTNWSPFDDKTALVGIEEKYQAHILQATSPKDQRKRYNDMLDLQEYERRLGDGNILARFAGGFLGYALPFSSPTSLIPIAGWVKGAKLSTTFLQGLPKVAGTMAVSAAAHNAVLETSKISGNLHDWAINTFLDSVFGTAFMGVHLGYNVGTEAGKLFNARKIMAVENQGIRTTPVVNEKGVVTTYKAVKTDSSVSAAEVDKAQAFIDAALTKSDLYAIPYIGTTIDKTLGTSLKWVGKAINPIIRMSLSPYETVRGLIGNVAESSFITEGIKQGRHSEIPFETMIRQLNGSNTAYNNAYNRLYQERIGIVHNEENVFSQTKANIQTSMGKVLKTNEVSPDEFGYEVSMAIATKELHENSAVNKAAELYRQGTDPLFLQYLQLHGISDKILTPKNTVGYLSHVYPVKEMETIAGQKRWETDFVRKLTEDDAIINELTSPIENARQRYKEAETEHLAFVKTHPSSEQIKISSDNVEALQERVKSLENELQDKLRENEDLHRLVEDRFAVSATEARQIKSILEPSEKILKELNKQKRIVDDLELPQLSKKSQVVKAKTSETAIKQDELKTEIDEKVAEAKKLQQKLQDQYDTELEKLQDDMRDGVIPAELFSQIPGSNRYALKDPSNRLKLRPQYESDFHRLNAAKGWYNSILNNTAEDIIAGTMDKIRGINKTNPIAERSIMVDTPWLIENKWINPDVGINLMNYRAFIGRQNAVKIVLDRLTVNGTWEEYIERFVKEHNLKREEISGRVSKLENDIAGLKAIEKRTPEQNRQLSKYERELPKASQKAEEAAQELSKEYAKNKKDLENVFAKMNNKSKYSAKAREYSHIANLYAVITKLGFMPFTMFNDLMGTTFKFGLWPSIRDGLLPMLKNLGGMLNTKQAEAIRQEAAHAHVGGVHNCSVYAEKKWTGTAQTYEPTKGMLTTVLEYAAHYNNNFTGANYFETFNQRLVAQIIQSKIIKAMLDFQKGKISKSDLESCLKYGIDPKIFNERFVNEWKAAGSDGNGFGGYQSNYWNWKDLEASNKMSEAITRATYDTVIRRGMFDAPFAMDNPLINSLFLFKGYVLATVTRYLAPLLQQPDADKLLGTILMMCVGAYINPLRRLVAGKDPLEKDEHMYENMIRESGVLSIFGDAYEDLNFVTHDFFKPDTPNERYQGRTEMGVLNGPIGSILNDSTRIAHMFLTGQINKTDLKRLAVNIPFIYDWQFRSTINNLIESSSYPKTAAQARKHE